MDVKASIRMEGGRRFSTISWGRLGSETSFPMGCVAGGLQDGIVSLWNPNVILNSNGSDQGVINTLQVHKGTVNCVEFHPLKSTLMVTCGDSEVKILNIENPSSPNLFEPSTNNKHLGSEVLSCAWNRVVPHILCSSSNTGTTVVWDLKQKKEVISFQDPASRLRCSSVAWHPEVPTQLVVCYDDDRQPSMQMWDLRNCQYPFKETAPHTKGVLSVAWNQMDPNLILSCGKDNRVVCTSIASGSPETWCEMSAQQHSFEVEWAPHKAALFSAASSGTVGIYSVQQQQNAGKYCPRWYRKRCGVGFGFGGKLLSFGAKATDAAKPPTASFCHSLVGPSEPEIVPTADLFEHWIAERRLREYCHDKTRRCGGVASHEGLMWELMGSQFEEDGRSKVPTLLGFDQDRILQEAERLLGAKPGNLMGQSPEEEQAPAAAVPSLGPELDLTQAESFFEELSASTEQKKREEMEREEQKKKNKTEEVSKVTDWSSGPEALIKQSLLVGNLTAAVELCFKSGKMAEALLLASGGGTTLWTRARDEYLRLQGDSFLTTVGNIMTNDFSKLVANSNLAHWMETLAIVATYSNREYQALCEQLAERLEKEKFDIRSAVICYICAKNFPKTVSIWANTHVASQGSQKLALQDLVEKMAVLQDATKFNQADPLFSQKLTKYAEILANSGRLTAAMRYLCLLADDNFSAILRDRIFNSAPGQMGQMLRSAPRFPFQTTEVRVVQSAPARSSMGYPGQSAGGSALGPAPRLGGSGAGGGVTPAPSGPGPMPMGCNPGMAAAAPPAPPGKSTAPTASAMPVTEGLPVAWPLPTKTMQQRSTNQSVAAANMAIQEKSASSTIGEPMAPHDVTHVRNVFTMLLDASQDGNAKKREDISKRLDELYMKLQEGQLKTACSQKVLQLAKAMEAQDYATASKVQQELFSVDWDANKSWLMGVKRIIPAR